MTLGSADLRRQRPDRWTTTSVAALRAAGIGDSPARTATPEFGLPCYTETEVGPPARTPWDLNQVGARGLERRRRAGGRGSIPAPGSPRAATEAGRSGSRPASAACSGSGRPAAGSPARRRCPTCSGLAHRRPDRAHRRRRGAPARRDEPATSRATCTTCRRCLRGDLPRAMRPGRRVLLRHRPDDAAPDRGRRCTADRVAAYQDASELLAWAWGMRSRSWTRRSARTWCRRSRRCGTRTLTLAPMSPDQESSSGRSPSTCVSGAARSTPSSSSRPRATCSSWCGPRWAC